MFYGVGEDFDNCDELDEAEECHHGVPFCDPCEDCDEESGAQSDDMGFHNTYS